MEYDICIIGAGWAGYNAALKAAGLGKKACIIEEREIGGTCLNRGCIPTKAFVYHALRGLPLAEIQKKKQDVIDRLRAGMSYMVNSKKIDYIKGRAKIKSANLVEAGESQEIKTKFILIATGSVASELPHLKIDHQKVVSSDDILALQDVPKKMLIIGGGSIGCEFASIFNALGCEVSIVEIAPQLLPGFDAQVSKKLQQFFQKAGIQVFLGRGFAEMNLNEYDKVLLAVGRKPFINGLIADGVSIKNENGIIETGRDLSTSVSGIFAAGDCIDGYKLAHVAAYEGELAVNNMFLEPKNRDYSVIPASVFTMPEVSAIGINEEEAKKFGASYKAVTVHFLSIGMAHIHENTQGFVKVIIDKRSGCILGAAIIGPQASELVNAFSIIMKNGITAAGLKSTIFAHPSISEIIADVFRSFEQVD